MIEKVITMWFFFIFFGLIPINYRALMAVDFSKIFRRNSTWQIRLLMTFISIALAFIISYAVTISLEKILSIILS